MEVCGDETILHNRSSPFERYFTFSRTETSQIEIINFVTLGFNFESSRVNCPLSYKFVQSENEVETEFNGPELSIDQNIGKISVDTSIPLKLKGFVTAYSYNSRTELKSEIIYINVCGYEIIEDISSIDIKMDLV